MVWNRLGESGGKGSPLALARKRLAVAPRPVTATVRSGCQRGERTAGQPISFADNSSYRAGEGHRKKNDYANRSAT